MNINKFYPLEFNGNRDGFTALMRTLLIKASYDSILKKITSFKGMHLSTTQQECWTIKFDGVTGVYGVLLTNIQENDSSFIGEFNLYYFPSSDDKYLQKSALMEEYLANNEEFISQVRDFSAYPELFMHFKICTLGLVVDKKEDRFCVSYETQNRVKTYTIDGIKDSENTTKYDYIIAAGGIDKKFPALRLTLPFFNFFNTLLTRINGEKPSSFNLYKTKGKALYYTHEGDIQIQEDPLNFELKLEVIYGEQKDTTNINTQVNQNNTLYKFLQKGTWNDIKVDVEKFSTSINTEGVKPRFVVVTGFLGSGKTNFIQNYIEYETQANHFVGIIQNEIGQTGLDSKLLDYDYSMVEIDEGCVCCSLSSQLRVGVLSLLEKSSPDVILLETTGVANPFNLLSEIEELKDLIEFESIVTVVDAVNYKQYIEEYLIFKDQIRAADIIILNKIDLVEKKELEDITKSLQNYNRCAYVLEASHCDINPCLVSNYAKLVTSSSSHIASEFTEETPLFRTHLIDHLSSQKQELTNPIDREQFVKYLQAIDNDIVRIKGFVTFTGSNKQYLIQCVNKIFDIIELEENNKRENFLIYIGKNMEGSKKLFEV